MKDEVRGTLHIKKEALAEKYLGLPTALGKSTKEAFEYMPGRLRGLMGGWSSREASCAGREVLLKSVAHAIPTYPMSCFLMPLETCKKMRSIIANYWWGSAADSRRIHWQRWDDLTRPKIQGGMGFRDLRLFNLAMLGKQGWRLMTRPDSLCTKVLKGRYFHDSDFLSASRKKHASHTWRAILAGREVLQQGLIRKIGNGSATNVWENRWIPNHFEGKPFTPPDGLNIDTVADLCTASGSWNEELIRNKFISMDADAILRTPHFNSVEDCWAWEPEKHGMYSVRSAYKMLYWRKKQKDDANRGSSSSDQNWRRVWRTDVPPKVKVFWWRVTNGFLPARQILKRRHVEPIANCEVCGADEESIKHVLIDCTMARRFWEQVYKLSGAKLPKLHHATWAHDLLDPAIVQRKNATVILCGMWAIWMCRNQRRHGDSPWRIDSAVNWALDTAHDLWRIQHEDKEVQKPVRAMKWTTPEPGWFKCNTDAAFNTESMNGASGAVVRDDQGRPLGGCAK